MTFDEAREQFPFTQHGTIYFNHASTGPVPKMARQKYEEFMEMRTAPTADGFPAMLEQYKYARGQLAKYLNTTSDRIAFLDNTTNGINLLATGIQWREGDRILLNNLEFPANVYPFLNLERFGVEVDFVEAKDGKVTADQVIEAMTPQTKLVSISYVQFLSGFRTDVELIGKICKERGVLFSVDAIQALGAIPIDVKKCNVDFLSCGTQKWMLGDLGLSFFYITSELQETLRPMYGTWTGVEDAWTMLDYNNTLRKGADAFQNGTINFGGVYGLSASLDLFFAVGPEKIQERILENTLYLMQRLRDEGFNLMLEEVDADNLAGIVTFRANDPSTLFKKMTGADIHVSEREGLVRLSPHFYNTWEEIDRVVEFIAMHK